MTSSPTPPNYLLIGEVLRPHGVRGELRVRVLTDFPQRVGKLKTLYLSRDEHGRGAQLYTIQSVRSNQAYLLIKLAEIPDRNAADVLRGQFIMVKLADAVPLEADEYYLYQIIGLHVQADGRVLGTLREVLETGANDVYVVDSPEYGELLLPAHDETIERVDLEGGMIYMSLPEGMLPSSSPSDD